MYTSYIFIILESLILSLIYLIPIYTSYILNHTSLAVSRGVK